MGIKYVKGDLLNAEQTFIVHQVNCQGVMGSGIAKSIRHRFPTVYAEYKAYCMDFGVSSDMLGYIQIIEVNGIEVCNLFSQDRYFPRGQKHTSYDALFDGFESIKSLHVGDIAMPKIGCGLGGGDWKIVSAIIESVFDDRDVYIYEL